MCWLHEAHENVTCARKRTCHVGYEPDILITGSEESKTYPAVLLCVGASRAVTHQACWGRLVSELEMGVTGDDRCALPCWYSSKGVRGEMPGLRLLQAPNMQYPEATPTSLTCIASVTK